MIKNYYTVDELAQRWKISADDVLLLGADGELPFGLYVDAVGVVVTVHERALDGWIKKPEKLFCMSGYLPVAPWTVRHKYLKVRRPADVDRDRIYQTLKQNGFSLDELPDELAGKDFYVWFDIDSDIEETVLNPVTQDGEKVTEYSLLVRADDVLAYEQQAKSIEPANADGPPATKRVLGALLAWLKAEMNIEQKYIKTALDGYKGKRGLGETTLSTTFAAANKAFTDTGT